MRKTFCNGCGKELGRYEEWTVKLTFSNDPRPPTEARYAAELCTDCAEPAISLVMRAVA